MANLDSAKKAKRVAERRRVINLRRSRGYKSAVKDVQKSITGKDMAAAGKSLSQAYQAIDKAVKGGVLKKNTAARMKSGLAKKVSVK